MYTDETVLILNNPTLLKTLWRPLDVCSWLVYFGDGMLSPVEAMDAILLSALFTEFAELSFNQYNNALISYFL
jgi:hypothetical protein